MNDESPKLSVQVPADFFKDLSTLGEEAKVAADAKTLVTLEVSLDGLKRLTALREDMAEMQRSQVNEWNVETDRFIKVIQMRISFYGKLILLAGGSFALSLTFLGSLQRHTPQSAPLVAMGRFTAAWVLLLVSIVFSWLHNAYADGVVGNLVGFTSRNITAMHQTWSSNLVTRGAGLFKGIETPTIGLSAAFTATAEALRNLSKKFTEDASEYAERVRRLENISAPLGGLALLSIITAFGLMIYFAVKNAALL